MAGSSSAPAANASVQVIGSEASVRSGTADKPLLPIAAQGNAFGIASGAPIQVNLKTSLDSGHARNGDMVEGTLAAPIGGMPAGTPVGLTVVAAAPAGQLSSFGVLSLQVITIANRTVLSQTVTAQGQEGKKELPDAAPERGTEAAFQAGQLLSLPAA